PGVKMLELLLPVLVVAVPVQLSPPATRTSPLCGRATWHYKDVGLGAVRQREMGALAQACTKVKARASSNSRRPSVVGCGCDRGPARSLLRNRWFARLCAGGEWIRTISTACHDQGSERESCRRRLIPRQLKGSRNGKPGFRPMVPTSERFVGPESGRL